jgi:hypothetical protein
MKVEETEEFEFGNYIPRNYEDFLGNYMNLSKEYKDRFVKESMLLNFNYTAFQILFSQFVHVKNKIKKDDYFDKDSYKDLLSKLQELMIAMQRFWNSLRNNTLMGSYYQIDNGRPNINISGHEVRS